HRSCQSVHIPKHSNHQCRCILCSTQQSVSSTWILPLYNSRGNGLPSWREDMNEYRIALIETDQIEEAKHLMRSVFEPSLESIFYLHPESTLVALYENKVVAGINLDIYQVNKH